MRIPETLEYEGTAYPNHGPSVDLPLGMYVVEDVQPAEPDVGIRNGYALIIVDGYDEPLAVMDYDYNEFCEPDPDRFRDER